MQLSPHFTLEAMTASAVARRRGIDNTPSPAIIDQLTNTALHMEMVRSLLGDRPILVSSGYRCAELNRVIGGASNSAHLYGTAVDFTCPSFGAPIDVARFLSKQALQFDQLIYEFTDWCHISFDIRARHQCLTIFNAVQGYLPGIVDG